MPARGMDKPRQRSILTFDAVLEAQWRIAINASLPRTARLNRASLRSTVFLQRASSFGVGRVGRLIIAKMDHGLIQHPHSIFRVALGLSDHGSREPNLKGV